MDLPSAWQLWILAAVYFALAVLASRFGARRVPRGATHA